MNYLIKKLTALKSNIICLIIIIIMCCFMLINIVMVINIKQYNKRMAKIEEEVTLIKQDNEMSWKAIDTILDILEKHDWYRSK